MNQRATDPRAAVDLFGYQLVVLLMDLDLHAPDSQEVQSDLRSACQALRAALAQLGTRALLLDVGGGVVRFSTEPLAATSLQATRLLRLCRERGITRLEFTGELDEAQLGRFLQMLGDQRSTTAFEIGAGQALLGQIGVSHVRAIEGPAGKADAGGLAGLMQYQAMSDLLQQSHVAAARGQSLEIERATGVVEMAVQQMTNEPSALLALASYDQIDTFTVGHSVRVALLALQVARAAGADKGTLLRIGTAALLHDIGKSRVPQEILFKRGELSKDEQRAMAQHPRLGGEILLEQKHVDDSALGAAFCHHMGPDGRGYPRPALPFEPSGVSKLVRVCDVFEAMTAIRPYKAPMSPLQAHVLMHKMRAEFDRKALAWFVHVVGVFPPGTRVELDDGSEAVVIASGPTLLQPRVRLLHGSLSRPVELVVGQSIEGAARGIRAVLGAGARIELPRIGLECGCELRPAPG
jgi:putative nucleotidyltransferase with HDIG domain